MPYRSRGRQDGRRMKYVNELGGRSLEANHDMADTDIHRKILRAFDHCRRRLGYYFVPGEERAIQPELRKDRMCVEMVDNGRSYVVSVMREMPEDGILNIFTSETIRRDEREFEVIGTRGVVGFDSMYDTVEQIVHFLDGRVKHIYHPDLSRFHRVAVDCARFGWICEFPKDEGQYDRNAKLTGSVVLNTTILEIPDVSDTFVRVSFTLEPRRGDMMLVFWGHEGVGANINRDYTGSFTAPEKDVCNVMMDTMHSIEKELREMSEPHHRRRR